MCYIAYICAFFLNDFILARRLNIYLHYPCQKTDLAERRSNFRRLEKLLFIPPVSAYAIRNARDPLGEEEETR